MRCMFGSNLVDSPVNEIVFTQPLALELLPDEVAHERLQLRRF